MRLINEGAPIAIAIPSEGIGWDMEASAIIKGTAKQDAAKALIGDYPMKRWPFMQNTTPF